jgi:SAM-dependent methyltransferase
MLLPKSQAGELKHRKRKRILEITAIMDSLKDRLERTTPAGTDGVNILEIGSGNGFQIPYLQKLGRVVASDIYVKEELQERQGMEIVKCDANATPFRPGFFNLIFLNLVLVYMSDVHRTLAELRRIGRGDCVYAITVPTSLWLILSLPAQYWGKLRFRRQRTIWDHLSQRPQAESPSAPDQAISRRRRSQIWGKILRRLLPSGHGVRTNFMDCWKAWRLGAWQRLFQVSGFSILETQPLLLYGPSEWPIIPTLRAPRRGGLCSSVLFLLQKTALPAPKEKAGYEPAGQAKTLEEV